MGTILHNLFHVIDCEQLWINQMQNTPVIIKKRHSMSTLSEIKEFSNLTQPIVQNFIHSWNVDLEEKILNVEGENSRICTFTYGKIMRHLISHEIHHIGQLSVWSRQLGIKPISSDLIIREY